MNYKKLSGVYCITSIDGFYYIGYSTNVFSRFSGHYNMLITGKHHSSKFQEHYNNLPSMQFWTLHILVEYSIEEFKASTGYKGKQLKRQFRRHLNSLEKEEMSKCHIDLALNSQNKHFSRE
mgnify:CR=1 FL=1|tara:strand:+ start:219 stop:581 length:363 start_codon:yes stop_codon:yes gene_type:complete